MSTSYACAESSAQRNEPMFATGNLSATFRWTCEKGLIDGQILLAPTNPPTLQALRFAPRATAAE